MPPRSLYIAFDAYPRPKGSSSHIASMIEALSQDFAPVRVLCLGDPGHAAVESPAPGIEIHRFHGTHFSQMLDRATAFSRFVETHAAAIAPSLQLMVFRDPWGGVPALRSAPRCPAIFEVNALPSWELEYSRPGFTTNATLSAKVGDLERFCLRQAALVLCVSDVTRRALIGSGGADSAKVEVVPNSAASVFFEARGARAGSTFAYVGGLQPWQGVEDLIDAFAFLAAGLPEARLLVAHSGNRSTREVERRIERHRLGSQVQMLDVPLSTEELAELLPRMAFTVAPLADTPRNTLQGCCPVKIVESMAAGCPVIASDLAVSRELIRHDVDGWLVRAGDHRAWASAIETLLRDTLLRDRLAVEARKTAWERFDRRIAHDQLRKLFQAAVAAADQKGVAAT
jgi:glycosyltransferase involved in cell wall biosynthesis